MGTAPAFASATEALDVVRAGLRFLATADATAMTAAERAACLRGLERADAVATAARTSMLGGFGAGQDYVDDGDYRPVVVAASTGPRSPAAPPRTTPGGSSGPRRTRRCRPRWPPRRSRSPMPGRSAGGPAGCPEDARAAADEILLAAAASGLELEDLAGLAAEMYEKSRQDKPDSDGRRGRGRAGRGVRRPGGETRHHPRRGRGHPRGPDPGVRGVRADRAGCPVRPGRRR